MRVSYVDSALSFTAKNSGTLYFRFNDPSEFMFDNSGHVSVSVTLTSSQANIR